jgi:CheY-like chemotaxis protein
LFTIQDLTRGVHEIACIDGFEVLRHIKETPILKHLSVIVLTSSKEEGNGALSCDIGVNSYPVKPVSFEGFLGIIRQIEGCWLSLNMGPLEENV